MIQSIVHTPQSANAVWKRPLRETVFSHEPAFATEAAIARTVQEANERIASIHRASQFMADFLQHGSEAYVYARGLARSVGSETFGKPNQDPQNAAILREQLSTGFLELHRSVEFQKQNGCLSPHDAATTAISLLRKLHYVQADEPWARAINPKKTGVHYLGDVWGLLEETVGATMEPITRREMEFWGVSSNRPGSDDLVLMDRDSLDLARGEMSPSDLATMLLMEIGNRDQAEAKDAEATMIVTALTGIRANPLPK